MNNGQLGKSALVSKMDYEELASFRYRVRRLWGRSERRGRRLGLTPQQQHLLLAVKGFPGRDWASITELAERLQIRRHSVVGIVNRCQEAGLVRRERLDEDRRVVAVVLTPKGEALLAAMAADHQRELAQLRQARLIPVEGPMRQHA